MLYVLYRKYFVCLIFVAVTAYENVLRSKIYRFTVCVHNDTFYALICLYIGWALGAISYGRLITLIPGGWLAVRYGGKIVFGIGIAIIYVLALSIPLAAKTSVWFLVVVRVAQGLAEVCSRVIQTIYRLKAILIKWAV